MILLERMFFVDSFLAIKKIAFKEGAINLNSVLFKGVAILVSHQDMGCKQGLQGAQRRMVLVVNFFYYFKFFFFVCCCYI